jgi:hypothetical protein
MRALLLICVITATLVPHASVEDTLADRHDVAVRLVSCDSSALATCMLNREHARARFGLSFPGELSAPAFHELAFIAACGVADKLEPRSRLTGTTLHSQRVLWQV